MQAIIHYFVKRFFINRLQIFFALPKFYAKHLGVEITGRYYTLYTVGVSNTVYLFTQGR
jgi:hypothetical protein